MPIGVDEKQSAEYSARIIRYRLDIPLRRRRLEEHDGPEVGVHRRVLRVATTERLRPLHELTGEAFVRAWFQCVQAHYLSWLNGIHRMNLSLNTLMYRLQDGAVCGVLDDWYLAIDAPALQAEIYPRSTLPFMAIDLLDDIEDFHGEAHHLYRYDLEALLWIFVWVVCCYKDGKEVHPLPKTHQQWTSGDVRRCRGSKIVLLCCGFERGDGPTGTWTAEAKLTYSILGYRRTTQLARDNKNWGIAEDAREEEVDEP